MLLIGSPERDTSRIRVRGQRLAICAAHRPGFGCGVNAANITHRPRSCHSLSAGDQAHRATCYASVRAARVAAVEARRFSIQAGAASRSVFCCFQSALVDDCR
jgi:hypothetical protein